LLNLEGTSRPSINRGSTTIGYNSDKVGHFVSTHKQAVITAATIIATIPLDETGIGEAIDADVIGTEGAADATADVVGDVGGDTAPEFFGGRGLSSSRDFDPAAAGGPIESLDASTADITDEGVDSVAQHLQRFVPDGQLEAPEQGMLDRISAIASGDLEPTEYDLNFYTHELDEAGRYAQLGYSEGDISGSDMYETWNNVHSAALEDYGISDADLYHPEVAP